MRIKLNMFFILFLFLCLYAGYILETLMVFSCVVLHELGHVFTAKKLRLHVEEIELYPFGGVARMEELAKYGGMTEAIVALAGPAASLLLSMMFYTLSLFGDFFYLLYRYNFILFLFNLIPALPMDGGRVLRNLLLHIVGYKKATRIMAGIGKILALMISLYNIDILLRGQKNLWYASIAFFIFIGSVREVKYCSYYYLLSSNNKKVKRIKQSTIRKRIINVHGDTYLRFIAAQFSPSNFCEIYVRDHKGKTVRVFSEAEISDAIIRVGYEGKIKDIL
ncbi:MAG: M50 family metallopeptidase [Bacillota bacterium]